MTAAGSDAISALEPKSVWSIFAGMSAVPRPSKREERIQKHIRDFCEEQGLEVKQDDAMNLVIRVPASPGCEGVPITVLQAHTDMVHEKNRGVEHDFENEGIKLVIDKDKETGREIVRADGTTLGADNGIGAAMGLAVATSKEFKHGPLEILLTTDEEAGMTGAKALTPGSIEGRRLINLDTEEDDALYIGCAGGCDTNLNFELPLSSCGGGECLRIEIGGLRGGHSGSDIHENRGNAIKLLTWTLMRAGLSEVRVAELVGGSKRNAIPREAHAVVCAPSGGKTALEKAAAEVIEIAKADCHEPGVEIKIESAGGKQAASAEDSLRLLQCLASLPSGVLGMSNAVPGLVQTSNNVSTVTCEEKGGSLHVTIGNLSRSSSDGWMRAALDQIAAAGRLAGAAVETANDYPGWEPDPDSKILATCANVYEKLFGEKPSVEAIHAGLECGIIGKRVGGMDMVSLGPLILGAHSPDERVFVESVQKSWKYLLAVLDRLASDG